MNNILQKNFSSRSPEYSLIPPSKVADKGNGIPKTSNDDILKQVLPYMEEGGSAPNLTNLHQFRTVGEGPLTLEEAKLQMQEIKRLADLKAQKEKSEKKLRRLTLDYRVNNVSKEATMRITRINQPLNLKIYDKFILKMPRFSEWIELHALASIRQSVSNDQLLKNLKAKFQWVETIAGKLGIAPSPQLTAFELPPTEKKRKRITELIQEMFVKEKVMVDGMYRNLVPPARVVGSARLVINEPESGIFVYNRSFDLVFQKENKFHLATTAQLIRIQNAIKIDLLIAKEMYDKMIYVIEVSDDFVEARKIVEENLDNLG
ncbi:hypothetical protein Tco_1548873 [Tanacetum coccineum]